MSKNYRFAFDIGTTSVGWAVLETDGTIIKDITDAGVRKFDEPREPKTRESKAVARRNARSLRRQIRRRRNRRKILIKYFVELGWLKTSDLSSDVFRYGFTGNPYKFRFEGLEKLLNPKELAEAVYHIAKRRGFKSNRKSNRKDKESSELFQQTGELENKMRTSGCRTIGEYLYGEYSAGDLRRIRGVKTLRKWYEYELELLLETQEKSGFNSLSPEIKSRLKFISFYQRPYELQEFKKIRVLGKCPLEKNELRAYRSHPLAARFRILKTINNIKIIDPRTATERNLEKDQKRKLYELLWIKENVKFSDVRKAFGLLDTEKLNLETEKTKSIKGFNVSGILYKHFNKEFLKLSDEKQDELIVKVQETEELCDLTKVLDVFFKQELVNKVLLKLHDDLPGTSDGTVSYSVKALRKIIPGLEEGLNEFDATAAVYGYDEQSAEIEALPLPDDKITNPSVNRTIHQFRRVLNALVKVYGKPDSMIFELVRDFGKSKEEKDKISEIQNKREKERQIIREKLKENMLDDSFVNILKYRLWEQQNNLCPYTGKCIGIHELYSDGVVEIDHILPISRSLDDSFENLVVCMAKANADKGQQTPAEWLIAEKNKYGEMIARINSMSNMSFRKKKRFFEDAKADVEEFIARQLNDTRYASRFIHKYAAQIMPTKKRKSHIFCTRGGFTGLLRKQWGLNPLLGNDDRKNREDLRHDALDAMVIGSMSRSLLQKLAKVRGSYEDHFNFDPPVPNFKEKCKKIMDKMIVSRMQHMKKSGAFHEQTAYSLPKEIDGKYFVKHRVNLASISKGQVDRIVDRVIKDIVIQALTSRGYDGSSDASFKKSVRDGALVDLKMKSGVPINKVRVDDAVDPEKYVVQKDKRSGKVYRALSKGNNYSIDIIEKKSGSKIKRIAKVTAVADLKSDTPANSKMTLHKSESVEIKDFGIAYVRNLSTTASEGPYVEFDLHRYGGDSKINGNEMKRIQNSKDLLETVKKVSVSVLGKLADSYVKSHRD